MPQQLLRPRPLLQPEERGHRPKGPFKGFKSTTRVNNVRRPKRTRPASWRFFRWNIYNSKNFRSPSICCLQFFQWQEKRLFASNITIINVKFLLAKCLRCPLSKMKYFRYQTVAIIQTFVEKSQVQNSLLCVLLVDFCYSKFCKL